MIIPRIRFNYFKSEAHVRRFNRSTIKNMIYGAGTILEIHPKPIPDRGMKPVFYKPSGSAAEAIKADWGKVGYTLSYVIDREAKNNVKK